MPDINSYLIENGIKEISGYEFYRGIFPEGSFEEKGVFEDGKYNGIIVEVTSEKVNGKTKVLRHTLTDDLEKISEVASRKNFCLMSPISYAGKSRTSANARYLYAMAIDLDGIKTDENGRPYGLDLMLMQFDGHKGKADYLPLPTYLVSSGTGLHIYYVFEKPVPLFPNVVKELEKLKKRLTWQYWSQGIVDRSHQDSIQYESLFQGFRMVGTATKDGQKTRAFVVDSGKKVDIEYLNRFVPEQYAARDIQYKTKLSLAAAEKKFPDWYQRRIIDKQPKGTWVCKRDLYDWWIRKIHEGASEGHRYWCIMTLATYARKCGIPREELEGDALGLLEFMNEIGVSEFTEEDVMHALEAYNDSYITYPIDTIVSRTDIPIQRNKRNWRKQEVHLLISRSTRDIIYPNGWFNRNGRPRGSKNKNYPKAEVVKKWRKEHPEGRPKECIQETGMSKNTVYKWWE